MKDMNNSEYYWSRYTDKNNVLREVADLIQRCYNKFSKKCVVKKCDNLVKFKTREGILLLYDNIIF